MHLEHYGFGHLVIDGRVFDRDVLVTPAGVQTNWWRKEGHVLQLEDLLGLFDEHPKRVIIGVGAWSRMKLAAHLEESLSQREVVLEVLSTDTAVERVNELIDSGATDWAAALHLTC
jgi:hypothetical protein